MDWVAALRAEVDRAAARALGEQDASPYGPGAGGFDRRYWAWKLVDFPEATFQRLVLPLALLYRDPGSRFHGQPEVLAAVRSGLACAARLQHANGSWDQAFPWEQSYGATGFLLGPILEAAALVDDTLEPGERQAIEEMGRRAAQFLCRNRERHGVIANHLAGAAQSLVVAAERFGDARFDAQASALVDDLLAHQSPEGWFPEYGGADPGYQTLCLDYLAAIAERRPSDRLESALDRAVRFLQWFVHPDGTLGGVYGSRRTALVYLAGLARRATTDAVAAAMVDALGRAMARADIPGPASVDVGNLAPLLTSTTRALPLLGAAGEAGATLPCDRPEAAADFAAAGLHVRGTARYYAVCGASNGGTLTVWARDTKRAVLDDGGYVARLADGVVATTQAAAPSQVAAADGAIEIDVAFARMPTAMPTPGRFLALRVLNLTVMRSIAAGNWIKRGLVRLLVRGGRETSLRLRRRVVFGPSSVRVQDRLENPGRVGVRSIEGGRPFSGIHMASAGYFFGARLGTAVDARPVDVAALARDGAVELTFEVP